MKPNLQEKTVIFFPIEAGLAHITRSLSVAQELIKKKYKVFFALSKRKQFLIKDKNIEVIEIGEFFSDEQSVKKIKDPNYIYPFVLEEIEILKKYKPDLVVVDFRLSALLSSKVLNIPVVFIINSDGLPFDTYLPNLGIPKFLQSLINPFFHFVIANFKAQYLDALVKVGQMLKLEIKKNDLFDVTYIIPEPRDYLPSTNNKYNINYVGPIWWDGFEGFKPDWLGSIKPDGRTIYLTFGGTGYDPKKLLSLSELLVKQGYRVIVSSSNIVDSKEFKPLDNLYVEKFLPGFDICKRVDLVVCHGGIGTMTQALISGKPIVAVPFNPDQYLHSFRFRELNLAKCVLNLNILNLAQLDWESYQKRTVSLPVGRILKVVKEILREKDKFKIPIEKFSKKFKGDGRKKAAQIIESMLKSSCEL